MAEEKKIIIDEDWKSQVASEKEQMARGKSVEETSGDDAPDSSGGSGDGDAAGPLNRGELPPASFGILISSLAAEAMMAMGQLPHPMTNELMVDRVQARFSIDMLEMLQEKTAGNLSEDEASSLRDLLHQLRMTFIGVA